MKEEQDELVKKKASKLTPNYGVPSQYPDGTYNPTKPVANAEPAGASVPMPDGAPSTDGITQPQQQPTPANKDDADFMGRAVSDFNAFNKQAVGTAHNIAHGFVNSVPGGSSASNWTHEMARDFIPGSNAAAPGSWGDQVHQAPQ